MAGTISELVKENHAYFKIQPYYVLFENRPLGASPTSRRIHAGFEVDVYGLKTGCEWEPPADYVLACSTLQDIVNNVSPDLADSCFIEIIPFGSTVFLIAGSKNGFQSEAMVRVRITHARGIDQPAGASEEQALKAIRVELEKLGVKPSGTSA